MSDKHDPAFLDYAYATFLILTSIAALLLVVAVSHPGNKNVCPVVALKDAIKKAGW